MDTESYQCGRRWCAGLLALVFGAIAIAVPASAEQQLTLGSVALKLGEPDSPMMQELSRQYKVLRFDGGWSIQQSERNGRAPGIAVHTSDGRVEGVFFTWGPGFTPSAEEVAEQLAQALPAGAQCEVRNITRPQESGTVRTLQWLCSGYRVSFVTGVWPQGNTASISIERQ